MPSIRYKLLPSTEDDVETTRFGPKRRTQIKQLVFYVLAGAAAMYLAVQGAHMFVRNIAVPMMRHTRFGSMALGGKACHRNLTTGTVNGLPAYFNLPSGDKIPSVALGTVNSWSLFVFDVLNRDVGTRGAHV